MIISSITTSENRIHYPTPYLCLRSRLTHSIINFKSLLLIFLLINLQLYHLLFSNLLFISTNNGGNAIDIANSDDEFIDILYYSVKSSFINGLNESSLLIDTYLDSSITIYNSINESISILNKTSYINSTYNLSSVINKYIDQFIDYLDENDLNTFDNSSIVLFNSSNLDSINNYNSSIFSDLVSQSSALNQSLTTVKTSMISFDNSITNLMKNLLNNDEGLISFGDLLTSSKSDYLNSANTNIDILLENQVLLFDNLYNDLTNTTFKILNDLGDCFNNSLNNNINEQVNDSFQDYRNNIFNRIEFNIFNTNYIKLNYIKKNLHIPLFLNKLNSSFIDVFDSYQNNLTTILSSKDVEITNNVDKIDKIKSKFKIKFIVFYTLIIFLMILFIIIDLVYQWFKFRFEQNNANQIINIYSDITNDNKMKIDSLVPIFFIINPETDFVLKRLIKIIEILPYGKFESFQRKFFGYKLNLILIYANWLINYFIGISSNFLKLNFVLIILLINFSCLNHLVKYSKSLSFNNANNNYNQNELIEININFIDEVTLSIHKQINENEIISIDSKLTGLLVSNFNLTFGNIKDNLNYLINTIINNNKITYSINYQLLELFENFKSNLAAVLIILLSMILAYLFGSILFAVSRIKLKPSYWKSKNVNNEENAENIEENNKRGLDFDE
ncbi:uncharacterized protein ASCRUDRAFT_87934 [Ascoidea rubescens DSM 1968]|uniref:Plasma membrane fusion protein PRM1 n=1 Tax=Ascoidea rubescens DSM 1968 TaxID=1344418 RepID=A0A1D2VAU1_9ASCO|nr:hypothetical protein ASCRUDRAFT_87934 [Ascoidea rubescens DSM 1968]ODV58814.1 hypothetical protein ASCRUDRAFT_87934 [Ascoidea rubescens DSM 1968]